MNKKYLYLDLLIAFINALLMLIYAIKGNIVAMALSILIIVLTFISTSLKFMLVIDNENK